MSYETQTTSSSVSWPQTQTARPATIHPEPESPHALGELSRAAADYAKAAEAFITARHALNDAKDEWQRCQQLVAGLMEKEGI